MAIKGKPVFWVLSYVAVFGAGFLTGPWQIQLPLSGVAALQTHTATEVKSETVEVLRDGDFLVEAPLGKTGLPLCVTRVVGSKVETKAYDTKFGVDSKIVVNLASQSAEVESQLYAEPLENSWTGASRGERRELATVKQEGVPVTLETPKIAKFDFSVSPVLMLNYGLSTGPVSSVGAGFGAFFIDSGTVCKTKKRLVCNAAWKWLGVGVDLALIGGNANGTLKDKLGWQLMPVSMNLSKIRLPFYNTYLYPFVGMHSNQWRGGVGLALSL